MTFKIPTAFNKVGVELELYTDKNLWRSRNIPKSIRDNFIAEEDGSLDPRRNNFDYALEFKSNGPRNISKLNEVLNDTHKLATMKSIGANFVKDCHSSTGFHIHFGIKSSFKRSKKKMVTSCLNLIRVSAEQEAVTQKLALRKDHNWARSGVSSYTELQKGIEDAIRIYPARQELDYAVRDVFEDRYGTNFSNLFYADGYKPTVEMRWGAGELAQNKRPLKKYIKHCLQMLDESFTGKPATIGKYELECTKVRRINDDWDDRLACEIDVMQEGQVVGKLGLEFEIE